MNNDEKESDFYVGYEDHAPARIAGFFRVRIVALLLAGPLLLGVVAAAQKGFAPSLFEFGVEREFIGWVQVEPIPRLISLRPGNAAHCGRVSSYALVSLGKFGAEEAIGAFVGRAVRVRGTLVYRDGDTMIELADAGVEEIGREMPRPAGRVESLGQQSFVGEIVDTKCDYGVMNQGSGKVHRACAALCISGGIPPALVVNDGKGGRVSMLLVDERGGALGSRILDRIGRPVSVAGEVFRYDDLLVLHADPSAIERLSD